MRKQIVNYARSKGVFLKVYTHEMLRALRHSDDDGEMCGLDDTLTDAKDFRGKARERYIEPANRELLMQATDPTSTLCKAHKGVQNVALSYARQIACLHGQNTGLIGVLALKPGRTQTDVVGMVFYHDWDEMDETRWVDDPLQLHQKSLTELELVCAHPGIGRLLVAYCLWDTYRRKRAGGHKFHGCVLNLALQSHPEWFNQSPDARYAKYLAQAQKHDGFKLYTEFGFRPKRLLIRDEATGEYRRYEAGDYDARGNVIKRTVHEEVYMVLAGDDFKRLPRTVQTALQVALDFCEVTHGQKCL